MPEAAPPARTAGNCILQRRSDKEPWQVIPEEQRARRPYIQEDCHVYETGAKLPLQQVGFRSDDGKACWWEGRRFPIGTEFWAIHGEDVLCADATLKDCSIGLPPRPMTAAQYVGSRADQGLVHGVTNLVEKFERGPQIAANLASGRLHVQTVAGEAYNTLKDKLGHVALEDTKKAVVAVIEAGQRELEKPTHEMLGDIAETLGGLPAQALENEMTAGLGTLGSGVTGAARTGARIEKTALKTERQVAKAEHAVANTAQAEHALVDASKARTELEAAAAPNGSAGRANKQHRLRELAEDPNVSSADRGWLKQEINAIDAKKRARIRNPPRKELAHQRGREAAKGYDYNHADFQGKDLHTTQHKYDKFGRKNKERPLPKSDGDKSE